MNLDCKTIERYLHEHIPLSQAMAVTVASIDEQGVTLSAPLLPNINHRSTVFGGSLSTLAILSAWTWLHIQLQTLSIPCRIVIQRNCFEYLQPAIGEFQAHCCAPSSLNWERFLAVLGRHNKSRITLNVHVHSMGQLAGTFQGEYVVLRNNS